MQNQMNYTGWNIKRDWKIGNQRFKQGCNGGLFSGDGGGSGGDGFQLTEAEAELKVDVEKN